MSKILTIKRIAMTNEATFGVLLEGGVPFAVSLEPVWMNNERELSCIPPEPHNEAYYICKRVVSPRFGVTFEVQEVPNRSDVLFHWGNVADDTKGCILVAEEFGLLESVPAVLTSRTHPNRGFNEFMQRFNMDDFILKIEWHIC